MSGFTSFVWRPAIPIRVKIKNMALKNIWFVWKKVQFLCSVKLTFDTVSSTLLRRKKNEDIDQRPDVNYHADIISRRFHFLMQISTSAPPTLTAVTPMRSVTIPWDRTYAHVKQDTQEMEGHALVSCKKCNKYMYLCFFWEIELDWSQSPIFP